MNLISAVSYSGQWAGRGNALFDSPVSLGIPFPKSVSVSNLNGIQTFYKISLLESCHF